jgi:hypothetical protein
MVKCSCLNRVAHSKESLNLLSRIRIQGLDLREREELSIWNLRKALLYFECQQTRGVGGGLFIVPPKESYWGKASLD